MSVLRNRPKGARFASFGLGLCVFALMPTRNRISGYRVAAGPAARRRRALAEAGVLRRSAPSRSPPTVSAVRSELRIPQPASYLLASLEQPGHRHHRFGDAQSDRAAAAALSGVRFPQGRSHAEGRPSRHRAACAAGRADGAAPALEDPSTSNASVEGPPRPPPRGARGTRAARSGTSGGAERAAAPAIRYIAVARSPAARRSEERARCCRRSRCEPAPSRDGFSVKTASLYFGSSSLGGRAKAWSAGSPARSR